MMAHVVIDTDIGFVITIECGDIDTDIDLFVCN